MHEPEKAKTSQLNVRILPPWWLSKPAIVVYSLIVLLIIAYFIQQVRNRRQYHRQIQQSEERLKLSLWGSGDEMWDWNIKTNKIYRSNIWEGLEFPQDGIRNLSKEQLIIQQNSSLSAQQKQQFFKKQTNIHPQDIDRLQRTIEQTQQNKDDHFEATYRVRGKDKNNHERWIWVLDRGKIVERCENKLPTRMTGTLKDISQIKNAEERLKLFAKCIENISDAVVIYNRQFKVVDVNKAYQKITGKSKAAMLNKELSFPLYASSFIQSVKKHLLSHGNWHGEIEDNRKNNELY